MENTFAIHEGTGECIIVDPGCYEPVEQEELSAYIEAEKLSVVGLINTHCHIDHVLGNQFIKDTYKVPLTIHPKEESMLRSVATRYAGRRRRRARRRKGRCQS